MSVSLTPQIEEDLVTLMRLDPFRELDRIMEQNLALGARTPRSMPMTAWRRGEEFVVELDMPGVRREDVELTVERNVVTVRARRPDTREEGDEVVINERPFGEYTRQLFLGDNLDAGRLSGELRDGVLRLTIPVSEASKPRRIEVGSPAETSSTENSSAEAAASGV
jgi:HSP20 family protein